MTTRPSLRPRARISDVLPLEVRWAALAVSAGSGSSLGVSSLGVSSLGVSTLAAGTGAAGMAAISVRGVVLAAEVADSVLGAGLGAGGGAGEVRTGETMAGGAV